MMQKILNPKIIVALLATYFVFAGITYAVFPENSSSLLNPYYTPTQDLSSDTPITTTGFNQFAAEPKTEACPLNGKLYSVSEKNLWETRRPILAMIENHVDSRPQSGLSSADIVYEAVAEGGITRFMGVFYCGAQSDAAKVAPVRSARIYFVNIAAEYNDPIYMHVGGGNCSRDEASGQCTSNKKAWALEELVKLGWRKPGGNDFDTVGDIGVPVMKRDYDRLGNPDTIATEHTYVGYLPYAWREAAKRGYDANLENGKTWLDVFKPWKTSTDALSSGSPANSISLEFWEGYKDFAVAWNYDTTSNTYKRNLAGSPHIDLDKQEQLSASNVIVQFVKEEGPLDEHKHMYYYVIGSGKGYLFRDGKKIDINWQKASQTARTIYTDQSGKEVVLTPGTIWVELLPTDGPVNVQ